MVLSFQAVGASGGLDPRVFQGFVREILSSGLRVALRDFCYDAGLGDSSGLVVYSGRSTLVSYIYLWFSGCFFHSRKTKVPWLPAEYVAGYCTDVYAGSLSGERIRWLCGCRGLESGGAIVVMSFLVFLMEFVICRISWRKVISNY